MDAVTLEQIRNATDAKPVNIDPSTQIHCICTDSRKIDPGCLFIALKGDNHDGHDHLHSAFDRGAVAAMVDLPIAAQLPLIQVDDTRRAMGRLANFIRRQMKCAVIAVAGSNGKTGTKNLIHAALKDSRTGTLSPKSFNNDIGVPTTIFAASSTQDYLVLEIGTNHPGEILNLTKIAEPDIAVITNIGAEHLEFLGDLDGVTAENAQIIAGLNPRGLLVVNGDSPQLLRAVESYPGRKITFGFNPGNDLYPIDVRCLSDGVRFSLGGGANSNEPDVECSSQASGPSEYLRTGLGGDADILVPSVGRHTAVNLGGDSEIFVPSVGRQAAVNLGGDADIFVPLVGRQAAVKLGGDAEIIVPLMGRHTAVNALAAIAVARELGVDDKAIFSGLATAIGPEMRLQLQTVGTVKILNDAYNANPNSMQTALETLRDLETTGRRVAILGDMLELGDTAERYHREAGEFVTGCGVDHLVCVGANAALIAKAAIKAGMNSQDIEQYKSAGECAGRISSIVSEGDLVLLKASRGMGLEAIATAITSASAARALRRAVAARTNGVVQPTQYVGNSH